MHILKFIPLILLICTIEGDQDVQQENQEKATETAGEQNVEGS